MNDNYSVKIDIYHGVHHGIPGCPETEVTPRTFLIESGEKEKGKKSQNISLKQDSSQQKQGI